MNTPPELFSYILCLSYLIKLNLLDLVSGGSPTGPRKNKKTSIGSWSAKTNVLLGWSKTFLSIKFGSYQKTQIHHLFIVLVALWQLAKCQSTQWQLAENIKWELKRAELSLLTEYHVVIVHLSLVQLSFGCMSSHHFSNFLWILNLASNAFTRGKSHKTFLA